jgi:hypothetical protein
MQFNKLNPFDSTFAFFAKANTNPINAKELPSQLTKHTVIMDRLSTKEKEARTGNSGFKKLAVQWLNEIQFFNQTFVQVDSFVLRNRQLLKPAKR